jgi:murein L,D-transpeptidase YafK
LDYKKDESGFYKAIHISYPNLADLKRAKDLGVEPGNMVMIHGQPNYATEEQTAVQNSNWTNGCIALLNQDMAELWELVEPGTPIEIRP